MVRVLMAKNQREGTTCVRGRWTEAEGGWNCFVLYPEKPDHAFFLGRLGLTAAGGWAYKNPVTREC